MALSERPSPSRHSRHPAVKSIGELVRARARTWEGRTARGPDPDCVLFLRQTFVYVNVALGRFLFLGARARDSRTLRSFDHRARFVLGPSLYLGHLAFSASMFQFCLDCASFSGLLNLVSCPPSPPPLVSLLAWSEDSSLPFLLKRIHSGPFHIASDEVEGGPVPPPLFFTYNPLLSCCSFSAFSN